MQSNPRSLLLKAGTFLPDQLHCLVVLIAVGLITTTLTRAVAAQSLEGLSQQTSSRSATRAVKSGTAINLATLPLGFEPNRGQMDPAVSYAARESQYTLFPHTLGSRICVAGERGTAHQFEVRCPARCGTTGAQAVSLDLDWNAVGWRQFDTGILSKRPAPRDKKLLCGPRQEKVGHWSAAVFTG